MPGSSCKNTVVYKKKQELCKSTATAFSEKKLRNKGKTFCHERRKKARHTEEKLKVCKSHQSWFPRIPLYQERIICTSTVREQCLSPTLNEKPYLQSYLLFFQNISLLPLHFSAGTILHLPQNEKKMKLLNAIFLF